MIGSRSFQVLSRAPAWPLYCTRHPVRECRPKIVYQPGGSTHNRTASSSVCLRLKQSFPSPRILSSSSTHAQLSQSSRQQCSTSTNSISAQRELKSVLLDCSDEKTQEIADRDFVVIPDFITEEEEDSLLKEAERFLKKVRYEYDHWDNAIHGFRETEKSRWSEVNSPIIQRIRDQAFPVGSSQLTLVHVLDLAQNGYIKPHVDSVKFCGSTIAGLSLLSPAIMRLVHTKDSHQWVNALLPPRSLYIMRDSMRYGYTHEVLKDEESIFRGNPVTRGRRISIMCRAEVSQSS